MSANQSLETRIEQMVDAYVTANPAPDMTPLAYKIKVFGQLADISSRLSLKYERGVNEEERPALTLPQH